MSRFDKDIVNPATNPILNFARYRLEQAERLQALDGILRQGVLITGCKIGNMLLTQAGRWDLAISDRAIMMPITNPGEIFEVGNNFIPDFRFRIRDRRESGPGGYAKFVPVPASEAEILALKDLPRFTSGKQFLATRESGKFPPLNRDNHAGKSAFLRMLILFPEFTLNIVRNMSAPEVEQDDWRQFEPELFVAYQIMSRLVDKYDLGVLRSDGSVDDKALTH